MRILRVCVLVAWVGGVSCLWLCERPLSPDVVIRHENSSPVILQISGDGRLATCRGGMDADDDFILTGPVSWYDRRTGRLIKTVFDDGYRDIQGGLLPGRPPIADLLADGKHVIADLWAGEVLVELPRETQAGDYCVSPDGHYVAWLADDQVHVIDTSSRRVVLERPAFKVGAFHGNEILRIRVREQDLDTGEGESGAISRSVVLMLPEGSEVETDSPLDHSALLSANGKWLLKTTAAMQAAICDPRTGAVIWETKIPYPQTPDALPPGMFSFDASGDELRATYSDEEDRPRFARWNAKDGRVIVPMPVAFKEPKTVTGVNFDAVTGTPSYVESFLTPYDGGYGDMASEDGRFIVQEVDAGLELVRFYFAEALDRIENCFPVVGQLQLSSLLFDSDELSPLGVFDITTGNQIGRIRGGEVRVAPDSSWFAVADGSEVRIYSAPFHLNWRYFLLWAIAPPVGFYLFAEGLRRTARRFRRNRAVA